MMKILIAIAVAVWAGASPTLAEESVRISDAWARASVLASRPVASYLTIESAVEDRLLGVATPVAGHVMIHAVEKRGNDIPYDAQLRERRRDQDRGLRARNSGRGAKGGF